MKSLAAPGRQRGPCAGQQGGPQSGLRARMAALLAASLLLAGCAELGGIFSTEEEGAAPARSGAVRLVERDEEAPEVFQVTEAGLWDGRPSLGGVWVAYPDVRDPERVIIRNPANDSFVIGALFRRERDFPGPRLQVSSDAASALGMLAGQPAQIEVTALRRQQVPEVTPGASAVAAAAPETIEAEGLGPVAAAAAALDRVDAQAGSGTGAPAARPAAAAAPAAAGAPSGTGSPLERPFVQVGIFSVEANARRTGDVLRREGIIPTITEQELRGRKYWRVLVGPAMTRADVQAALATVRRAGYTDAFLVAN